MTRRRIREQRGLVATWLPLAVAAALFVARGVAFVLSEFMVPTPPLRCSATGECSVLVTELPPAWWIAPGLFVAAAVVAVVATTTGHGPIKPNHLG